MLRVTSHGGHVLLMAEPDYGKRLDAPDELVLLGALQARSLRQQGADPDIGARLASLFPHSGCRIVESGTIDAWLPQSYSAEETAGEWQVLREDLKDMLPAEELTRLMAIDEQARRDGRRVLRVPTHFVHAQV
jgi:hypothetical protein